MNRVCISGNLTRDVEYMVTKSGSGVLKFSIAVNERRKNQQTGEWEEKPNFFDCVMFGGRTEWLSQHMKKGMKVLIDGKLSYSSWEKDGQKRSKVEITVFDIELPPRQKAEGNNDAQYGYGQREIERMAGGRHEDRFFDEDCPF